MFGDPLTDFRVPDMRGVFLRGVADANGADPDRNSRTASAIGGNTGNQVGSYQGDAFKSHSHSVTSRNVAGSGGNRVWTHISPNETQSTGNTGGSETRPKNVYVNYIIKY